MRVLSGTPHVFKSRDGKKVILADRTFNGIERNHTDVAVYFPDEARYAAQQMLRIAESIDGKSKKDRTKAQIIRNTEKIAREAKKEALK